MSAVDDAERAAVAAVAPLAWKLLDLLVDVVGGRSRVEAMLAARYAAADAEVDALEAAKLEAIKHR